jgi:hypothetical protein
VDIFLDSCHVPEKNAHFSGMIIVCAQFPAIFSDLFLKMFPLQIIYPYLSPGFHPHPDFVRGISQFSDACPVIIW